MAGLRIKGIERNANENVNRPVIRRSNTGQIAHRNNLFPSMKPRPLIAVVDDEEPVRKALQRFLRAVGFEVEVFPGGEEFLRTLPHHQPDCAVLDLHMPEVTGFDVQAKLAKAHPRVPVVIITGHDSNEAQNRAVAGGASAYLRKPVDGHVLLDSITSALGSADERM